jgi:hypothetical protein
MPDLPEWVGPPVDVLGGVVALGLIAARSKDAAVWLESATAFPTGVQFRIEVRWRAEVQNLAMRAATRHVLPAGEELPPELFRAGFELPDGSTATWLGAAGAVAAISLRPDERPKGPVLRPGGGGGGNRRWSQDLWPWPLPPEGRLEFVCEWPALGIELTRAALDSGQIREAAKRCERLWENGPEPSAPSPTASGPS